MTINQKFRAAMEKTGDDAVPVCSQAREWVRGRSLVQAWRDCKVGAWMAYWLYYGAVPEDDVYQHLRRLSETSNPLRDAAYTPEQAESQRRYADRIRQHYTPSGKRRSSAAAGVYMAASDPKMADHA